MSCVHWRVGINKTYPVIRYAGEKKLEPSEIIVYSKDGDKYTVTLKDVKVNQSGLYVVKAKNEVGEMSASCRLKVIRK